MNLPPGCPEDLAWTVRKEDGTDCAHCVRLAANDGSPLTWRCPKCRAALCGDCQYTELDCYDTGRRCPGCGGSLPDSDGNAKTDWAALGFKP